MHFSITQFDPDDYLTILDDEDNYYAGGFLSLDSEEDALILNVEGVPQVIERKRILRMYGSRSRFVWFSDPKKTLEACSTIETTDTSKFKPGELLTFMGSNNQQVIAQISKIDSTLITADIVKAFQQFDVFGSLDILSDRFILRTDVSTSADAKSVTFNIGIARGGAAGGVYSAIHTHMQNNPGWNLTNRK
ncbi:hypothetical protein [Pseudomonas fluorescens]|uniref:Uncharacterized protein n=1 Tax=Pseudomonas fluorescens TaxID=294 RepID=A0AAE2A8P2_PSEFL|nr:hypothetical protein [Pseudomonas fluorescens]KIF61054.1 hypothetical protein QS95_10480 [Pseudomonas fluorescens]